ncbi:unnamed protein product [Penicillium glandicola]
MRELHKWCPKQCQNDMQNQGTHRGITKVERSKAISNQRVIYATYLSAPTENKDHFISEFQNTSDPYFDAARILTYQLLHAPETRTRLDIPFVVFVHQNIDQEKRERLQSDGAQVIEWSDFRIDWVRPAESRWVDTLTKLRLWEMVQYDLIVFLDGDSVLTRCIDGLLSAPMTWLATTTQPSLSFNGVEMPLARDLYFGWLAAAQTESHSAPVACSRGLLGLGYLEYWLYNLAAVT